MALKDIIRYEGTNDVLVFKHPTVDFNRNAQLTVHEKQEAIVFMNGKLQEVYQPGTYELESENIPGVKHIVALFSGGELANHCEVYFINKLLFANIPWVTTKMDIQDKIIGNYHSFWAQGSFNVRVENSRELFEIIGNGDYFTTTDLKEHFQEKITSVVKEQLSIIMNQEGFSYGEINSHFSKLSERVFQKIKSEFHKIGLLLETFEFTDVNIEKDLEFDKHREHLGERIGQQIQGYTYDKKRMYDVMEKQAENQAGSGAAATMMSGAGFGMGIGQVYSGMVGGAMQSALGNSQMFGPTGIRNNEVGVIKPHPIDKEVEESSQCSNCGREIQSEWVCCPYCRQDI